MTEKSAPDEGHKPPTLKEIAEATGTHSIQPANEIQDPMAPDTAAGGDSSSYKRPPLEKSNSMVSNQHVRVCEFPQMLHSVDLQMFRGVRQLIGIIADILTWVKTCCLLNTLHLHASHCHYDRGSDQMLHVDSL